jgi:hypothetical protein
VPILSDFRVVGLLEIFSPHPRSFTKSHGSVLDRLVEIIPKIHRDNMQPETEQPENNESKTSMSKTSISEISIMSQADSAALQPPVAELKSNGTGLIDIAPEALAEHASKVPERVARLVPEPIVVKPVSKQAAPKLFSGWLHRALLGLSVAVVAIVVGYLVSSQVEKRWADSPPASQSQVRDRSIQAKSLADLRTLADRGDAEAQYQMGVRYDEGDSVPKDDAQAVQWFQHAAEQGHVDAQAHLGAYYWAGRGVPEDLSKAYMWSMIAVAGGDENSKSRLEGLASQMTRAQVSAARQQAEEWIRTHSQQAKSEAN